jgi:predicted unusual protein kinase regulating ubiquinone biosynthesis (AarF/ABC1/UbiB family)
MIDFGACGVFSERERNLMWQLNYCYSREDVGGMVNMVISIMEPVKPPVRDWDQFRKELLDIWWKGFYGIKSKHAEEWERSSFRLWLGFFHLMKKHNLAVPRNMVRMIRATLLYDTVAASLHNEINVFKEFQKYSEGVAKRTRRRMEESAIRQLLMGPDDSTFLKLRQIADVGNSLLFRVQKFLDDPEFSFAELAGKVYSAVRSFVRMLLVWGGLALTGVAIAVGYKFFENRGAVWNPVVLAKSSAAGLWNPRGWGFQIIVVLWSITTILVLFAYGRRVYLRFGDTDD